MELKNFFAQDDQGNKLPGANCYLYERGTESLVRGLQKANGVPLSNPFVTDSLGLAQFAAPNGIYDIRVVAGKRDYRLHIQFNDVNEDLAAARSAASRAEQASDAALLSKGVATSIEAGLQKTVSGEYFSVPSADTKKLLMLYLNSGGVPVPVKSYPSAEAVQALEGLIQPSSYSSEEKTYLDVVDLEGGRLAVLTEKRFATKAFEILNEGRSLSLVDGEGAAVLYSDEERTIVGGLEIQYTTYPGVFITDPEGGIMPGANDASFEPPVEELPVDPFEDGLMFSPVIATAESSATTLYVRNLLPDRTLVEDVVATASSTSMPATETGPALKINAITFGDTAVLNLRSKSDAKVRKLMNLRLVNVPVQNPPVSVKILLLGDSITNRQGGTLLKRYLEPMGITPVFIGTMKGSNSPTSAGNDKGELGEAREGWESGDYTNDITDRALIIPPGGESEYLGLSKAAQRDYNPFAREATGNDPSSIVRNGRVFDPAHYQSRFGLETPDVVFQSLGTNNVRDRSSTKIYAGVLADDTLIHDQIRAAWPNAKIVRAFPGTSYEETRNDLWKASYLPMLRAIQKSAADRADSKMIIAPLWAMMNPECGYDFTPGTVEMDGFYKTTWNDPIHPYGSSRLEMYRAIAPYIAAAALNLI